MKICLYVTRIRNFILDILFPIKCIGCDIKDEILCDNCIFEIHSAEREMDKDISAVFDYRDKIIKKAIWELKYYNKRYLGEKLGKILYESLIEDISDIKIRVSGRSIFVIPVPISKNKTKLRGYNQSLAIAKGFCNQAKLGIFELKNKIVFKKIDTIPQARLTTRKKRLENIKNAFEIKNKNEVFGRTIIVIDDVTTTGGTINEMIRILKDAGAKQVVGFAIAH